MCLHYVDNGGNNLFTFIVNWFKSTLHCPRLVESDRNRRAMSARDVGSDDGAYDGAGDDVAFGRR